MSPRQGEIEWNGQALRLRGRMRQGKHAGSGLALTVTSFRLSQGLGPLQGTRPTGLIVPTEAPSRS